MITLDLLLAHRTHLTPIVTIFSYQNSSPEAKWQGRKTTVEGLANFERDSKAALASRFRKDLFWKKIFVSGIPEINENELSAEIFNGTHESAFPWQKTSGFLRSYWLDGF
jgi:hypothetical protein